MENQNKTTRSFRCDPNLWGSLEQMSEDFHCSIDLLINEAMRFFARQRGIEGATPARFTGEPPAPTDTIIRQFLCRDTLWDAYTRASHPKPIDVWLNIAIRSYIAAKSQGTPTEETSEATMQEPLAAFAFSNRSPRRYSLTQVNEEILLGKGFAFFKAAYFDNPSMAWVKNIYGVDLSRPTMASFLGGVSVPGVDTSSLPAQRFAIVASNDESYLVNQEPVQLLIVFPGLINQSALLDLWDESSHLASIPVCTGAHDVAVISLHRLAAGEYRVTLRGGDANEPPCLFRVVESKPSDAKRLVSGIYLQQGEGRPSPFALHQNDGRLELEAQQAASQVSVLILDPAFPMRRSDALDPTQVQHPAQYDELYRVCDRLFQSKQYAEASAALREARSKQRPPHPYYAYNIACCEALLGRKDKALSWVKTAIRDGFSDLEHIKADDDFAALREEPLFQSLFTSGKIQLRYSELKAGERVALPTNTGALLLAAYIDGIPWEGWALQWNESPYAFAAISL
jgi:hypothetical protein